MPPWKAAPNVGPKFQHDRSLSDRDVRTITAWAEAGAPEGDPADLPPARTFPHDWTMEGGPDLIVDTGVDFEIPAAGDDVYRCFVVPTSLPDDMYIAGVEFAPGNRRIVHHVLAYVEKDGQARKKDAEEPGPGYTCFSGPRIEKIHGDLGGWAPGNEANFLPDGVGRTLPRRADVVLQVHYHPSGKVESALFKQLPPRLPALMFAEEVAKRIEKKSLPDAEGVDQAHIGKLATNLTAESAGQLLYGLVAACRQAGIDPESALRKECDRVMRDVESRVQARN